MIRFDSMSPEVMQAMCTPMHEILPRTPAPPHGHGGALYLGALSASLDGELLRAHGVVHVVQVLDAPWAPDGASRGLEVYQVALLDTPTAELRPHLEGACDDIERTLARGKNVLVHCQQGISRSAAVVIAYLIRQHAMTFDQALAFVKSRRACAKPNPGFVACLREWERQWRPQAMARRHTTF